ncbi:MAG: hybrid sensor histidine kinase/response regulator [Burkholderiaceae bacterium]|nr:hybrid sensor histidine kinase/response regulator [Burkholderiaceae bacterium]
MNVFRPPQRFGDTSVEVDFLTVYRRSGLRLAKIAFTAAGAMTLAFWLLLIWFPTEAQASAVRQDVRLALTLVLLVAAANLHFWPKRAIRSYEVSVGIPMAVGCLVLGSLGFVPLDSGDLAVNRFVVGATLACWLCYGFTRLPVALVAAACVPASVLTLAGVKLQGDDHALALSVYLIVANLIGWILSVEIERRERALFWSARQLAEARVRSEAMAHRASEADVAKTRVLAAVSHDLRQPLASLTLYAQHLREHEREFNDSGVRQALDGLEACIGAISSDLDRLSELGLRGSGAPFPVESIDLRNVLERIDRVYSGLAARAAIRLVVRVPAEGECRVLSNESRLWDIFANLVGNALKFAAPGRPAWVLVRVRSFGGGIEVVVRDNGIGIDAADQRRVFDEYFQVSNPSRSSKQGHGLGLSIVCETVSRLPGHSIRLSSSLGRGTVFALHLPGSRQRRLGITAPTAPRPERAFVAYPLPRESMSAMEGRRVADVSAGSYLSGSSGSAPQTVEGAAHGDDALILVVEDDEAMGEALRRTFERWGFEVESVQSGEDAISLVSAMQRSFDAIVSDFRLPGAWDGLRLIEELRRLEGMRTPAILLSGEFRVEALRCDAPGDVHVMAKPPDVARLRELLRGFARGRAAVDPG